jgi:putative flippase GtrA
VINKILTNPLYQKHGDKLRFLIVGITNTLLDLLIFALLANVLKLTPITSNIISVSIVVIVSFYLNYYFVWRSKKSKLKTAPQFIAVSLFTGYVIQSGVIWLLIKLLNSFWIFDTGIFNIPGADLLNLFAKCCGIAAALVVNFIAYRFIFKSAETPKGPENAETHKN